MAVIFTLSVGLKLPRRPSPSGCRTHNCVPLHIGALRHGIEPHVDTVADHFVDVDRHTLYDIRSDSPLKREIGIFGLFGDNVQRAAGRSATTDGRTRSFEDFELLGEEVFADETDRITNAAASTKTSLRASKPRMA